MKLFLALILISSMALAEPPHDNHCKYGCDRSTEDGPRNPNGDDPANNSGSGNGGGEGSPYTPSGSGPNNSRGGAGGSGSVDNQVETVVEVAGDDNRVDSQNTATNTAQGGSNTTNVRVIDRHDEVANTVPSLNLAHCSDGAGAAGKSASVNTGGVNYVCESTRGIATILLTLPQETPEDVTTKLEQAKDIKQDVYDYLKLRKYTAAFGAAVRDLWLGVGILGWILL